MSDGRLTLALDTSTVVAVGLARGGELLASERFDDTRAHVEQLLPLVRSVLDGAGLGLGDVERLVVGTGPGPFTGLRVGIATAEVLALALGVPLTGVTSLDVLARQVARSGSAPEEFLVVSDARRREVYWSAYRGADADSLPIRVAGPDLIRPDELATTVPDFDQFERIDAVEVSAGALGMLAERMFEVGRPFETATPLYLRSPDVTIAGGPKRVSS